MRRHYIAAGACIVLLAVSLLGSVQAHARPGKHDVEPSITGPFGDVRLGGEVWFETVENLRGREYPMVQIDCDQGDRFVWSTLIEPDQPVKLGGDWSDWQQAGGPALCIAYLLAFGDGVDGQTIRPLADTGYWSANG